MKAEVINRVGSRSFASCFIKIKEFASDLSAVIAGKGFDFNARRYRLIFNRLFVLIMLRA